MKFSDSEKLIPVDSALEILEQTGFKQRVPSAKIKAAQAYIASLPIDENRCIRWDVLNGAMSNALQALKHEDPELLLQRRGFWVKHVPDSQEIVESKQFANKKTITWPTVLENLWFMHHDIGDTALPKGFSRRRPKKPRPPCIIGLSGCQGGGKSQTTYLSAFITLVHLFSLHDPHLEFNHDRSGWIIFAFQSIKEKTGEDSLYIKLKNTIDQSPWFEKYFPRNKKVNEEIRWPDHMIKVMNLTGEWDSGLGKDVFWAGINEINEMRVIERSRRVAETSKTRFDIGERMWNNINNRMETRFQESDGSFPGKLIADSARSHTNDFTARLKEKAKNDSNILLVERSLWEAKKHDYPKTEKRFLVELGDEQRVPRIITNIDQAHDRQRVVRVPERHRKRFDSDCEEACKYFIGEPTRSIGRFVPYPERITRAQEAYIERFGDSRPFKTYRISFHDMFPGAKPEEKLDWSSLINYEWFDNLLDKYDAWSMHCDMAATQCDAGFSFGCICDTKSIGNALIYDPGERRVREWENIEAPVYLIAGILAIHANPGETIDPGFVQALGLELKRLLPVRYGSSDWFESNQMLLAWKRVGIIADHYSLDKKPDGYYEYLHALRDERIVMMPHPKNDKETRELKREIRSGKVVVTKSENGTKDLSDSVAGITGVLGATEAMRIYRFADHVPELDDGKRVKADGNRGKWGEREDEDEDAPILQKAWRGRGTRMMR